MQKWTTNGRCCIYTCVHMGPGQVMFIYTGMWTISVTFDFKKWNRSLQQSTINLIIHYYDTYKSPPILIQYIITLPSDINAKSSFTRGVKLF